MFGLGSQELMVILLIALFLFGAQKLPELARGLGKSVKEFKKATEERPDDPAASGVVRSSPPDSTPACAACQAPLRTGWAHCPQCGEAVATTTAHVA